jgi:uncharacterized membrane protein YoaK (UPF0700 family)
MNQFLTEVRQTLAPERSDRFGPLPPLFIALTFVTGLVDASSYLMLGHVFVANMTGNVVFLGFAIAGAHGFSIAASLTALAAFGVGSIFGGRVVARHSSHRGRHLAVAMTLQSVFLAIAVVLAWASANPPQGAFKYSLIIVLSLATGGQNANARKLAVPDLTTTVLTMTVTGIGADSALGGGKGSKSGRRMVAIAAMFSGALIGALLVLHIGIALPLTIALAMTVCVGLASHMAGRSDPAWTRAEG